MADRSRKNRNQPGFLEVSDVNDFAGHDGREHSLVTLTVTNAGLNADEGLGTEIPSLTVLIVATN